MEEKKKQTIYGRIAKWASWGSLALIIAFIASILIGDLTNSGAFIALARWLILFALMGFLTAVILTVAHRLILGHSSPLEENHLRHDRPMGHADRPGLVCPLFRRHQCRRPWLNLVLFVSFALRSVFSEPSRGHHIIDHSSYTGPPHSWIFHWVYVHVFIVPFDASGTAELGCLHQNGKPARGCK